MNHKVTKVHPSDNLLVALIDLKAGEVVSYNGEEYMLITAVKAKHKFVTEDVPEGSPLFMYGVLVGMALTDLPKGSVITTANIKHAASGFEVGERKLTWDQPDVSKFKERTFMGYHRADGRVGTANHWLVIPMVFCENRNLDVIREALVNELGYGSNNENKLRVSKLIDLYNDCVQKGIN